MSSRLWRALLVLPAFLSITALTETLSVSGSVVRSDTRMPHGGAPLGIYPGPGARGARLTSTISRETGTYLASQDNVFLSTVYVLYEGDYYSATPVKVDLEVRGNARVGNANTLTLYPRPAPGVSGIDAAAGYLAAESNATGLKLKMGTVTQPAAATSLRKAVRAAAAVVSSERALELYDTSSKLAAETPELSVEPLLSKAEVLSVASAIPQFERRPDSRSDLGRNCPECREGEALTQITKAVPHGVYVDINDPPCSSEMLSIPEPFRKSLAEQYYRSAEVFSFALEDGALPSVPRVDGAGDIARYFRTVVGQPQVSNCTRLGIVIPKAAAITRVEKVLSCEGWCRFLKDEPEIISLDENLVLVSVVAKNWSHNVDRVGTLKVFYRR